MPALAQIWRLPAIVSGDLNIYSPQCSSLVKVARAAVKPTGFVNFRNEWRTRHVPGAKSRIFIFAVLKEVAGLKRNDQDRVALAAKVDKLLRDPPPGRRWRKCRSLYRTDAVDCLSRSPSQIPTINGRDAVRDLLKALGLAERSFPDQVTGMVGLIGKFGIADSFVLDVLADDIIDVVKHLPRKPAAVATSTSKSGGGSVLPDLDVAERLATQQSQTIRYRNRHNKMTNGLKLLCDGWRTLKRGTAPDCSYDVLIEKYDATGRDLLVEAKPDPDKGSLRIVIR